MKEVIKVKDIINEKLPFIPTCPNCKYVVAVEKDEVGGYHVKCGKCNSDWETSPFTNEHDEAEWLEKFNNSCVKANNPTESHVTCKSDMKVLLEIAHSSEKLREAYDLVCKAHDLINEDKVARQYIKFNAEISWRHFVWDILMKHYNIDNPDSKDVYFLRAFDYYGIHPGMYIGEGNDGN